MTVSLDKAPKHCGNDMCGGYESCLYAGKVFVNVHEISQAYGGPEEGGWWVTCGEFIIGKVTTPENLDAVMAEMEREYPEQSQGRPYYSVNYHGGDYRVSWDDHPGESYPRTMPHYE